MANSICELMDKVSPQSKPHQSLVQFVTDRAGHDWRYAIDSQKIIADLNWKPKETFLQGMMKTIQFYL